MDGYDHNTRWRTFKTMILAEKSSGDYRHPPNDHAIEKTKCADLSNEVAMNRR
jgi:hypothetical protein